MSGHEADDRRAGGSGDENLSSGITAAERVGIVDTALEILAIGNSLGSAGANVREMGRSLGSAGSRSRGLGRDQLAAECLAIAGLAGDIAEMLQILRDDLRETAKRVGE